jgi:hypothetical protein
LFSLGTLGSAGPAVTIVQLQPYFSKLGYAASIISYVRFFSLFFDAVTDPLMGYISDHTVSRFGRRMPYIAVGSLLFAAGLMGMWFAPAGLAVWQFYVYLVAMQIVFTIGVTRSVRRLYRGCRRARIWGASGAVPCGRTRIGGGMRLPGFASSPCTVRWP